MREKEEIKNKTVKVVLMERMFFLLVSREEEEFYS
jgi:hypothetical protein